jgi:hypothetical protein
MTRLARAILVVDAVFFLFMGISSWVFDRLSYTDGSGLFGGALRDSPHVLGLVEAHMLITVIGIGLLAAAFSRPTPVWHFVAVLSHIALASVDIGYQDQMTRMGMSTATTPVIASVHAVLIIGHVIAVVRRTPAPASDPRASSIRLG